MYIKMQDDKSLVVTSTSAIFQGEQNIDHITFFLPQEYDNTSLADCSIFMRYILPDGRANEIELLKQDELYHNYMQYSTPILSQFTAADGALRLWLTGINAERKVIIKTSEINVPVSRSEDITDYFPHESVDRLDAIDMAVLALDQGKGDSLIYDEDTATISLVSNGKAIGTPIDVLSFSSGTGGGGGIPPATGERLGLVRGSSGLNGVEVAADGTMTVASVSIDKLTQEDGMTLILTSLEK